MTRALYCQDGVDCEESAITVVSPCGSAWRALLRLRVNVLVSGPGRALDLFITSAYGAMQSPICVVPCRDRLTLKRGGTLVLRDVDALTRSEQARLYAWLEDPANMSTQVVSVTTSSLFHAVAANSFDEALYYRLNSVSFNVHES